MEIAYSKTTRTLVVDEYEAEVLREALVFWREVNEDQIFEWELDTINDMLKKFAEREDS